MIRTDLAVEAHNCIQKRQSKIHGVRVETWEKEEGVCITDICIESEEGAKIMERPEGSYLTIDFSKYMKGHGQYPKCVMEEFTRILKNWIGELDKKDGFMIGKQGEKELSVLIAGLGNEDEIIDALGPKVVEQIPKSRHLMEAFGKYGYGSEEVSRISGIVPGIRDETGMEAQEILKGIIQETNPDLLITVDALVGRSSHRIGSTIQLTNVGIVPGSGIGAHRRVISSDTMGIPVITVGVPTVLDVSDGFFLVPKDITFMVNRLSCLIAEGISKAF